MTFRAEFVHPFFGGLGIENDLAGGRARRGGKALGDDFLLRLGIEARVKELVELLGIDAEDRFVLR